MNLSKNNCLNCGKIGHQFKTCEEPILSYGIVCFNINPLYCNIKNKHIETYFYNKFIDISEYNYSNLENIHLIPLYYDKIKLLMVRRKHSLNYIEFIRGKYDLNTLYDMTKSCFMLMSKEEIHKIKTYDFDLLWNELWNHTAKHKIYQKEYNISKEKFTELKNNDFFNMLDNMNLFKYAEPEWGFPKGRRNASEKNLMCALREFNEETHIDLNQLHIMERLNPVEEEYVGTNSKPYRHIYYLANSEEELELSKYDVQLNEIGDIGWFTIPEAIEKIRPYHDKKIKMIHMIYFFIINMIVDINNNPSTSNSFQ